MVLIVCKLSEDFTLRKSKSDLGTGRRLGASNLLTVGSAQIISRCSRESSGQGFYFREQWAKRVWAKHLRRFFSGGYLLKLAMCDVIGWPTQLLPIHSLEAVYIPLAKFAARTVKPRSARD